MAAGAETELTALHGTPGRAARGVPLGARAEAAIKSFYDELKMRHEHEAGRLQQMGASTSPSKRNRQRLYLDDVKRGVAEDASRRHLQDHPEWISGSGALLPEDLRAHIALQHFTAVDMEDLELPEDERRNGDLFDEQGICEQFILDAGRSTFVLGGETFGFASELEAAGVSREDDSLDAENRLRAFEARLAASLRLSLGGEPPRLLLQGVSRSMSQSGMANVERACSGPQVVVSGGEQALRYELRTVSQDSWEVCASMRKWEFEEFVVVEEAASDEPGKVTIAQCSSSSYIARTCSLRFQVQEGGIHADVCGFSDQVWIVDDKGKPIHLPGQATAKTRTSWRETLSRFVLLGSWHFSPATLLLRCRHCRRRARSVARTLPSGLSLQPLPGMAAALAAEDDPENAMRAPLREPAI
mmetsp:Transcript_102815/g.299892  ORF Transcript_102815/g.299892 Transcript_102815/m.299892 type:complete len:415 (+) Transcript_102815:46-1290(+)